MGMLFRDSSRALISSPAETEKKEERGWLNRRRADNLFLLAFVILFAAFVGREIWHYRDNQNLNSEIENAKSDQLESRTQISELSKRLFAVEARPIATTGVDSDTLAQTLGLIPTVIMRNAREHFVELYSYDDRGASSYGTAGYLGNGYFITVKHGVVALGQEGIDDPRKITLVNLMYKGKALQARVVDVGDARVEVDPGDWAVLKVKDLVDLPALDPNLSYGFEFADPIFRLGNDYSKGIILSTGYVGPRTGNQLVTCLTDGHPGVSGGGVLNRLGQLVGIPIGRMQGDYRFSFILPLRKEMFRKVPHLWQP